VKRACALLLVIGCVPLACGAWPAFRASGDLEQGDDRPCVDDGRVVPWMHGCQVAHGRCCPIGAACGEDEFVPPGGVAHPVAGVCRWYGTAQ
jgi:hypothetical protein